MVQKISTTPYTDQLVGTSGLRKKTKIFIQENYLENYIQSIFNVIDANNKTLLLGGDGRYFCKEALQKTIRLCIANGVKKIFIPLNGLICSPALSIIIREKSLDFGINLSASHNPGGIDGDFGVKFNKNDGSPADQNLTSKFEKEARQISSYNTISEEIIQKLNTSEIGSFKFENTEIEIIDAVKLYTSKMQQIFNFDAIKEYLSTINYNISYNAFNGSTGPFALDIFHNHLGVPKENIVNSVSKEDFGGNIPDPNPNTAKDYVEFVKNNNFSIGMACDSDGDRSFIFSPKHNIEPSDSLAVFLDNIHLVNYYKDSAFGVARSKATANAVDKVAERLNIPCYEVPTGWKFFATLLDNNKVAICGEDSYGLGSFHSREKDGIWSLLYWLFIISSKKSSLDDVIETLWDTYGRVYFVRHDYENLSSEDVTLFISNLEENAKKHIHNPIEELCVKEVSNFEYKNPITKEITSNQGLSITLEDGSGFFVRASGTATSGTTMRVYQYKYSKQLISEDKHKFTSNISTIINKLTKNKLSPTFIL